MSETLIERLLQRALARLRSKRPTARDRMDAQLDEDAADALTVAQARIAELEESLHLANGVADLAIEHRDEAEKERDAARARIERLERGLTPRRWTREMNDAWHRSIPDVEQAFAGLRSVLFPDQEGELERDPSGQATREPSPSVSALTGGCPSRDDIALVLYHCEYKRAAHADNILGLNHSTMEPWDECKEHYLSDADAVLAAFRVSDDNPKGADMLARAAAMVDARARISGRNGEVAPSTTEERLRQALEEAGGALHDALLKSDPATYATLRSARNAVIAALDLSPDPRRRAVT